MVSIQPREWALRQGITDAADPAQPDVGQLLVGLKRVVQIIGFVLVLVGLGMSSGCAAWDANGAKYDNVSDHQVP